MEQVTAITIREIDAERDHLLLERFDGSFTTDRIYVLSIEGLSARFEEKILDRAITKRYDLSGMRAAVDESSLALAAGDGTAIEGLITVKFERWNRRLWITHLYVGPSKRGAGIGSRLIAEAERFARRSGARGMWLETQNFNYPAIQFYLRRGFRFCGFDESLYDPEVVPGETAIYFSRDL